MKRYGLPYMGSKNKIAQKIVDLFPTALNFYDLFCGGCAITHCAMVNGKFKNYIINDIQEGVPKLFIDSINGKYKNEKRWISREDFYKLKDSDEYIALVWSFGNKGSNYLYAKEIEPWKKAYHYACFGDYSYFEDMEINIPHFENRYDLRKYIKANHSELREKYIDWYFKDKKANRETLKKSIGELTQIIAKQKDEARNYLVNALKESGLRQVEVDKYLNTQMSGHYFGRSQWEFPTRENYKKLQEILPLPLSYDDSYGAALQSLQRLQSLESLESLERLQSLQRLQSLESLESLERLQSLERLERLNNIKLFTFDYAKVPIKEDSVIYCDIPYENTTKYRSGAFNYNAFLNWACNQEELVFISSYEIQDSRFIPIWETHKRSILNSKDNTKIATERVYIPKNQLEKYKRKGGNMSFI